MAIVSAGGNSRLNPNAPLFIPAAVRQVEDFSPEWWNLVKTSTWFHHYWLNKEDQVAFNEENVDVANFLPDSFDHGVEDDYLNIEAQIEEFIQYSETEEKRTPIGLEIETGVQRNLFGFSQERGLKSPVGAVKYNERSFNSMSSRYNNRRIHQPR